MRLETMAHKNQCTAAQLALAWVASLPNKDGMPPYVPIPETMTADRIIENWETSDVELNDVELHDVELNDEEIAKIE